MDAELIDNILTEDDLLLKQQGLEEDKAGLHIPQEDVEQEMNAILWS